MSAVVPAPRKRRAAHEQHGDDETDEGEHGHQAERPLHAGRECLTHQLEDAIRRLGREAAQDLRSGLGAREGAVQSVDLAVAQPAGVQASWSLSSTR